jgi:hypothetical protein
MATKATEKEVLVTLGYGTFNMFLPASRAAQFVEVISHATFITYSGYQDGEYVNHSTKSPEFAVTPNPQPIAVSIAEATVADIPLRQYLRDKELPYGN